MGLVNRRILEEIPINKIKKGYVRGPKFDDAVTQAKEKTL